MVGLILCVVIFGFVFGFGIYEASDGDCGPFGALIGVLVGFVIWLAISVPMVEKADSVLINSMEYKIEIINGQYWETNSNGRKVVHYIDAGKELQSYIVSLDEIEFFDEITEPILIVEKRDAIGWFVKFWCGGDTNFTEHRLLMPRLE